MILTPRCNTCSRTHNAQAWWTNGQCIRGAVARTSPEMRCSAGPLWPAFSVQACQVAWKTPTRSAGPLWPAVASPEMFALTDEVVGSGNREVGSTPGGPGAGRATLRVRFGGLHCCENCETGGEDIAARPGVQLRSRLAAAIAGDVLQEGKVPGPLDRGRQLALLPCGAVSLAARQNLAPLIKAHLETLDVLVIDHLVVGENRLLAPAATTTPARPAFAAISGWSRRTVPSGALSEARTLAWSAPGRLVRLLVVHIAA
jgi:hypothetical protein